MSKKRNEEHENKLDLESMSVVLYAERLAQAKNCEELLKSNNIPAIISDEDMENPIVVLVPENLAEEAREIIDSEGDFEDYYRYAAQLEEDYIDVDFDRLNDYL